jgi:hypothetical protein
MAARALGLEQIYNRAAADARAAAPVPYFDGVRSVRDRRAHTVVRRRARAPSPDPWPGQGAPRLRAVRGRDQRRLTARNVVGSPVERIVTPRRGVEETVLTFDGDRGRIELPMAIGADRDDDARIIELRLYYSTWPFTGRHANRPPVLPPDPAGHRLARRHAAPQPMLAMRLMAVLRSAGGRRQRPTASNA